MTARACHRCGSVMVPIPANPKLDRLDQCGLTYLPAARWQCPKCEETIATRPTGEPCRASEIAKETA